MALSGVSRAAYRALRRSAARLAHEVERHGTCDAFTEPELETLRGLVPGLPAALSEKGPWAVRALLDSGFREPAGVVDLPALAGSSSSDVAATPLDAALCVLGVVNRRLDLLAEMASEPRSETVTGGVRVAVESRLLPELSSPRDNRYHFAYRVVIRNEGDAAVRLISRQWVVLDDAGQTQEVTGLGVLGHHPFILPGQQFEYSSKATLGHMKGSMRGSYVFVQEGDSPSPEGAGLIDAEVAPFALRA